MSAAIETTEAPAPYSLETTTDLQQYLKEYGYEAVPRTPAETIKEMREAAARPAWPLQGPPDWSVDPSRPPAPVVAPLLAGAQAPTAVAAETSFPAAANADACAAAAAPPTAGAIPSIPISPELNQIPFQLPPALRVKTVVIDNSLRDTGLYAINDFSLKLTDPLRGVVAIRPLRTEFTTSTGAAGYLYLNAWNGTLLANKTATTNLAIFRRILSGTDNYPAVSLPLEKDPWVYLTQPVIPRLDRFDVKILQSDGSPYPTSGIGVVLTIAIYYTGVSY